MIFNDYDNDFFYDCHSHENIEIKQYHGKAKKEQ